MSILQHLLHPLMHLGLNVMEGVFEEQKRQFEMELEAKKIKLDELISDWIKFNKPIPASYKQQYPLIIAEICKKYNRMDLVPDLMPKYLREERSNKRWMNFYGTIILLVILSVWIAIIWFIVYLIRSC